MPNSFSSEEHRIAFFVSSHGLGHAARAAGIMAAMHDLSAAIRFEIFTAAPYWFFEQTLSGPFSYHPLLTDIGLVQSTPFHENLLETLKRLDDFLPLDPQWIERISRSVLDSRCELILCDISPVGIAVGRASAIQSVLVDNFTWDWIYEAYT